MLFELPSLGNPSISVDCKVDKDVAVVDPSVQKVHLNAV